MPRSASDATRFTSWGPHAAVRPGPPTNPTMPPGPPGETPMEKVKRLREAAQKIRQERTKLSGSERLIARGRVWANRAHRITAVGLMAFTGVSLIYSTVVISSMLMHNRKKRAEYYAERKALIGAAQDAREAGLASATQLALLDEDEKVRRVISKKGGQVADPSGDAAAAAAEKKGILRRSRDWLFSGLKKEDDVGLAGVQKVEGRIGDGVSEAVGKAGHAVGVTNNGDAQAKVEEATRYLGAQKDAVKDAVTGEESRQDSAKGGLLDQLGPTDGASSGQQSGGRSWASYVGWK